MLTLDTPVRVIYTQSETYFLETEEFGNFLWEDPSITRGPNQLTPYPKSFAEFQASPAYSGGSQPRYQEGRPTIQDWCGKDVKLPE